MKFDHRGIRTFLLVNLSCFTTYQRLFGGRDYGHHVDLDDLEICLELYSSPKKMYCQDIEELAYFLLPQHQRPRNPDEAYALYRDLLQEIEAFI